MDTVAYARAGVPGRENMSSVPYRKRLLGSAGPQWSPCCSRQRSHWDGGLRWRKLRTEARKWDGGYTVHWIHGAGRFRTLLGVHNPAVNRMRDESWFPGSNRRRRAVTPAMTPVRKAGALVDASSSNATTTVVISGLWHMYCL